MSEKHFHFRFRKIVDLSTGDQTYCRGECIEYKTVDYTPGSSMVHQGESLDNLMETFHIKLERTSKILYLSKRLRKINAKSVKRLHSRTAR